MAARLRSPFTIRDHYTPQGSIIWCDKNFNCGRHTTMHTQEHVPTHQKCTFIYIVRSIRKKSKLDLCISVGTCVLPPREHKEITIQNMKTMD
jgi:hypothetical protein